MRRVRGALGAFIVLVSGGIFAASCGGEGASIAPSATDLGSGLPFAAFRRSAQTLNDRLPAGAEIDNVVVNLRSTRRLASEAGFELWGSYGAMTDQTDWSTGLDPTQICLYVGGRRGEVVSVNCAPVSMAAVPGGLSTLVSGGATGAPGFRSREFVYAAILSDDVESAQVLHDGEVVSSVVIRDNSFLYSTRRLIDAVRYETSTGAVERPLYACQTC